MYKPHPSHFEKLLGHRVRLSMKSGVVLEGEAFTIRDRLLVLRDMKKASTGSSKSSFVLVNIDDVSEKPHVVRKIESVLSPAPANASDPAFFKAVTAFHEKRLKERKNRLGKNVTLEAQNIFDILDRTFNVSWNGKIISVMDDRVRVSPPYTPEACACKSNDDSEALSQVRKAVTKWHADQKTE